MIHIEWTIPKRIGIIQLYCIGCYKKKANFIAFFQDWYGWYGTCIRCGEQFSDEEWIERPFARGWRKKNIKSALEFWKRQTQHPIKQ